MCGIFGYLGPKDGVQICLDGLKLLEYRGYDSSGIAGVQEGQIKVCKELGKISVLEEVVKRQGLVLYGAIAHTRWATHGKPSKDNAHPQLDQNKAFAVVHNGVIENHAALHAELAKSGKVHFSSETDTETIAQLLGYHYQGDMFATAVKVFSLLEGSFAVALIQRDHPDEMIVTAEKSPLVVGFSSDTKELFIASDPNALASYELDIYILSDGEIAHLIKGKKPQFFSRSGKVIEKHKQDLQLQENILTKGKYDYYMEKEIFEQSFTLRDAMHKRYDEENKTAIFEELSFDPKELSSIEHIILVACGTSWHAAFVASYYFEEVAGISTRIEIASEYRYKTPLIFPNTLIIALSQSGETADTIAAMRRLQGKGARTLALCNVPGSTIAREADATIFLHAGPEVAVASTKTFTSQVCILYLLTLLLARQRKMRKEEGRLFFKRLYELPEQVIEVLHHHRHIEKLAKKYAHYEDFYFLGRGVLYPTALEAALKLKEIAYINAVGYPSGEMKHGPIALLGKDLPVVIFCANAFLHQKVMSNLMESKARGAPILVFGWTELSGDFLPVVDDVFYVPKTSDALSCILLTIATQLFAFYIAKERGAEIDQPRNLAKSVTVE